jgi:arginyl-tRNA--protein-N-Asp/Glu arginylyltransferase
MRNHLTRAARAGLPYVYLGYWVDGSPRMAYKTSFRPLERLGRDGWRRADGMAAIAPHSEELLNLPKRDRSRILIGA